nr:hypothetical protein [Tanacetum cinerariifolium]
MQKVWILVDLPYGKRAIGTKWVFRNKKDKRGIVVRNKARLVAQGHTQEEGIGYEEVFAPVARIEAIRLFLAYVSFMGFMVYQMDVKSAFLYRTIEDYICQPLGFKDLDHPNKVYKVVKMSSMGELTFFLGVQVKKKKDGIFINQDKYVAEILRKFGLQEGKSASTLIDTEKPLLKDPDSEDVDVHTYWSMIGSLMYLTSSRPDIMFAVCACARFQVTSKSSHLYAVNRIFRYLKGKPHWAYGVNTPRSDEDRLELMELMVFLLPKVEKVRIGVNAVDLQVSTVKHKLLLFSLTNWCSSLSAVRLQVLVDKKKVVVTKAKIREALRLDDEEGVDYLPNEEIFAMLARMGYEKPSTKLMFYKSFFSSQWNLVRNVDSPTKFYMYPHFLQLIIRKQVGDLSIHTTKYTSPALTHKVFVNIRRVGKGFYGVETPLFERMLVEQQNVEEGDVDEIVKEVNAGYAPTT